MRSLQDENQRLRRAMEKLSILNDLARAIGASLNTPEIIQTIVRRSFRAVDAEQDVMTLVEDSAERSMETLVRTMATSNEQEQFRFNQSLLGWMHFNKKPLIINEPRNDERFRGVQGDESIRCLLCVPMTVKSELRGVLTVSIDDRRIAICPGNLSGKGLPAALLMANLQATLRGQRLLDVSPRECVRRANMLLFMSTSPEKFATLFYGILDTERHVFTYANAGHENPYLYADGEVTQRLAVGGIPLGMLPEYAFEEGSSALPLGASVVVYLDAMTEAMNARREQFGEERVATTLAKFIGGPVTDVVEHLIAEARAHGGSVPQSVDMTVVAMKRVA